MEKESIYIIGAGGVASCLLHTLSKFKRFPFITIIDGDVHEEKNKDRQNGVIGVAKADYWANILKGKSITEYITKKNFKDIIPRNEKALIIMSVDNHKTRKVVQDECCQMKNVTLISGGNHLTTGDATIFKRVNRVNLTPRIDFMQPEIQNPQDRSPEEISCEERVESEPQIVLTNNMVAMAMLNMLYQDEILYTTVYIDIIKNSAVSRDMRTVKGWK